MPANWHSLFTVGVDGNLLSQTLDALEKYDNQHDFERMAADILNDEGNKDVTPIAPRGGSDEGKDITYTKWNGRKGLACATIGYKDDISKKFYSDFSQRKRSEYQEYSFFCTAYVSSSKKEEFRHYVLEKLDAELLIRDIEALRSLLDTKCQYIRKHYLDIDIERHNWVSLLAVCKDQRRKILKRYSEKYDPSLHVQRNVEQKIDSWYHQAAMSIRQSKKEKKEKNKAVAQLLALVDQAGTGKTNVLLRIAEEYGKDAPVLVIPGSFKIVDDHSLEREIVDAVGYPVKDHTYHAKMYELCQIAQHEGYPLLVIVEGVNENNDLGSIRQAIEQVLIAYQDYPLLLLITCRDTVWPLIQSSALQEFTTGNDTIPLGSYSDEEFEQACRKYFTRWNVSVELSVEAKQSLRSPLLLRIFAEVNQGCSFKFVPTVVTKNLWEKYLSIKIDAIHEALGREKSKSAIRAAIEAIASRMLEHNSPSLTYFDISDPKLHIDPDDTSTHSLFLHLKNLGVLYEDTPESVSFVYETFLEYVAGRTLAYTFEKLTERENTLGRIEEIAHNYRWRQILLYSAELVSEPDAIIERLRLSNIWLAAQAFKRAPLRVSPKVRQQLITDLEEKLKSKFSLDRQRAADFLGLLEANESKEQLLRCWTIYKSDSYEAQAVLRALARLGIVDIVEPFIHYLGRLLEWYLPHDQELVDTLPEHFRHQLLNKALVLLQDSEQMYAAAHSIGYLRAEQAVTPLRSHLEATEWRNWVALLALVHIGTEDAFNAIEVALGAIGAKISAIDQLLGTTTSSSNSQEVNRQVHNELYGILEEVRVHGIQHCSLKKSTPFLVRLLEHPNEHVRHEAIQGLRQLGASETALAIIKSRPTDTWRPGFGIAETLTAFGTQIDVEPIIAIINDTTTPEMVLRDAIKALGVSRDRRILASLSTLIAQHRFLFEVVQALGNSRLSEAIPLLVQVLEDDTIDFTNLGSLSREMLDDMVVSSLGEIQHPDAFEPIEQYARKHLPKVGYTTISALVASDGERAIPFLQQVWESDADKIKTILRALLWIGTRTATDKIIELLQPIDGERAALLANALSNGKGLDFITGSISYVGVLEAVDSRLVTILSTNFDEMDFDGMWRTVIAMKYIGTLPACQLLERIATNPKYDEILFPNATPGSFQTIRQAAIRMLCDLGSNAVIDTVLDSLSNQPANIIEFRLSKIDYGSIRDALQRRLHSAEDLVQVRLLTLLGTFGDHTVLPTLQPYINSLKQEIADVAFLAEQRILGLAYF